MKIEQFRLLTHRRFLPLFITQFLGAFNDNFFKNALVMLITYRLAESIGANSQILVTLAAGLFILPFFLFSAMAGQIADKFEKSSLIIKIKFLEIVIVLLASYAFYTTQITFLMICLFLLGAQAAFFGPLKYAILPEHLREDELIAGNGFIEAGTFLAILFGTILGGMLILKSHSAFIVSMSMILAAVLGWVSSFWIPKTITNNPDLKINYHFIQQTKAMIFYAKQQWDIFLTILGISWFWLVGAVFLTELPVFVKQMLNADQSVVTFFFAIFSIGIALGSVWCSKLLKGKIHATYVPLGALGITLFIFDLYFAAHSFSSNQGKELINLLQLITSLKGLHITFDLFAIAVCGGIYTVPLYAILQHRSEKSHRARVIASNNIFNALFMVLAAIASIIMIKIGLTVVDVFLIIGIFNLIVSFYICKLLPGFLVKSFARWILTLIYRVKVNGLEHFEKSGKKVLIIANHTSFLDAVLLAAFLPARLNFAVNTYIAKKWWVRLTFAMINIFVIDPTKPMAIKSLVEFLRANKRCVIFPEGRITVTGSLMKVYEGPGFVADKAQAPLLPIRIEGAQYTPFSRLKGKVRIRLAPKITLTIFPPQRIQVDPELKGRMRRQALGYQLYDIMVRMIFESSNYHQTLFSALLDAKKIYGRHHEIVEDVNRTPLHYQRFIMGTFVLGNEIAKLTQIKENVAILLPNMVSTSVTFFALHAYGRIPVMLNFSTGIRNVLSACSTAQVKLVLTSERFIEMAHLEEMIKQINAAGVTVLYLEHVREKISLLKKLKGLIIAQFAEIYYYWLHKKNPITPESPAVILFTSGSEGAPKGVVLSHVNLQANRYQLSSSVDFSSRDIVFNALPLFHSFGLTGGMLLPIFSGVKIFFYPSPLHYRVIPEMCYEINATLLFGTDTFLSGYAKYANPYDFYSLRYVFAGAEKLRDETRLIWTQKYGVKIFEGYGTTETSPVIAANTPMNHKAGTVGRLLPGIEYRIKPVPDIQEGGELIVSGPNVMKGYLFPDQPGVIVPPNNGEYATGDIVAMDNEGYFTIKGRAKRFAKIAGEMISLSMVEQYLYKLWPYDHHAVVSMPDEKKGELLVLVTTYSKAARKEIVAFAKENLIGEIAIPKKIVTIEKMPLLGTGKIDYPAVKELL